MRQPKTRQVFTRASGLQQLPHVSTKAAAERDVLRSAAAAPFRQQSHAGHRIAKTIMAALRKRAARCQRAVCAATAATVAPAMSNGAAPMSIEQKKYHDRMRRGSCGPSQRPAAQGGTTAQTTTQAQRNTAPAKRRCDRRAQLLTPPSSGTQVCSRSTPNAARVSRQRLKTTPRRKTAVKHVTAPRGTFDILPPESAQWQELERVIDEVCTRFGYQEIRTPIFESTDVFTKPIGEGTDIVDKEMYTFTDRGGRSITLRPELTAPVVRAVLEHNLLQSLPLKLYYRGPIFRYERPQKGRYRQAHQWGVECFGAPGPEADAEIISLGLEVMRAIGITEYRLEINSLGCESCRHRYREALVDFLRHNAGRLSETSKERLERNPLRILDSKDQRDIDLLNTAPTMDGFLCDACQEHFATLRTLLERMGIRALHNPHIVRGLDYYTRTVFEISSSALGAQNSVCGGGRYDGLVKSMGGPPTPGVGLAMGIDRMLMLARSAAGGEPQNGRPRVDVVFVALDEASAHVLVPVMNDVRARHISADMDYTRRHIDKQLRAAGDSGARYAVIVGEDERRSAEATIQDLATRERSRVALAGVAGDLANRLRT